MAGGGMAGGRSYDIGYHTPPLNELLYTIHSAFTLHAAGHGGAHTWALR